MMRYQPVTIEVDTVAAHQVDRALALDQLEGSLVGDQDVHIELVISASPHGNDWGDHLGLVVALRFNLEDAHLVLFGLGHQNGGLEEQPVTWLDARIVLVLLLGGPVLLALLWTPGELLVGGGEGGAPEVLLLVVVTSHAHVCHPVFQIICNSLNPMTRVKLYELMDNLTDPFKLV